MPVWCLYNSLGLLVSPLLREGRCSTSFLPTAALAGGDRGCFSAKEVWVAQADPDRALMVRPC